MSKNSWFPAPDDNDLEWICYEDTGNGGKATTITNNNLYTMLSFTGKDDISNSLKFWKTAVKQIVGILPDISFHEEVTKPTAVTEKEAECIAYDATEHAITIIQARYDAEEIIEDLVWISQIVMDDIVDYIADLLDTDYDLSSSEENAREDVIEQICSMINWDHIYCVLEEYSHQPRTMSEKLRDIGMRESDFL